MAQVLVRDLSDEVVADLKERARFHGRSLEAHLRVVLTEAAYPDRSEASKRAARIRAMTPKDVVQTPSEVIIREEHERRGARQAGY